MIDLRNLTYTYFKRTAIPRRQIFGSRKSLSVLELGAGISPVACNTPSKFYLAIDIAHPSRKMDFPYVQGDARNIPLKNESIDFFISISMLEHTKNPMEILTELHRISRHGGIISVPSTDNFSFLYDPVNRVRLALGLPLANYGIGGFGHLCVLSDNDWRETFEKAGFKVSDMRPSPEMDIFETLEFCLLSIFFSRYEYNELLNKFNNRGSLSTQKPNLPARIVTAFAPVLKKIWKILLRLNISAPGSVSTTFTLERRNVTKYPGSFPKTDI